MSTVASFIVDTLISMHIKRIYGIAGDSLNAFTDAVRASKEIEWITMRHEEAAAFAAGAEAQLSGSLTVCAGSCGPGNLHLINGLYDCHRSQVPVLAIAAHIPTAEIGSEYFQETHPERLFLECSQYCEFLSQPEQTPRMLQIAIQRAIALSDVSVLIIPGDISWKKIESAKVPKFYTSDPIHLHSSSDRNLDDVAKVLNESEKVAILAGIGCAKAHKEVIQIASRLKSPIIHTLRSKDFLEFDNPYDVGLTGLLGLSSAYEAIMECNTLLMLGTDFPYRQFYPENAKIIQIDIRPENIGRRTHVDYALIGDVKQSLKDLIEKIDIKTNQEFLDASLNQHQKDIQDLNDLAVAAPANQPLHPQYLTKLINDLAASDAIFTCDVGTPTIWAARYLKMNGKRKLLGSFKHGSMASALPQAIGAQLQFPHRQVITLSGDGGIAMLMGDLLTLKQYNLPIKVIVYNNSSFGFVELEMKSAGILEYATDLKNPDFSKIADAIGIKGIKITSSEQLSDGLQQAFQHQGPVLIEVMVERQELAMPPKISASEFAGMSLYMIKALLNGKGNQLIDLTKANFF